jgi:hypothetical protein
MSLSFPETGERCGADPPGPQPTPRRLVRRASLISLVK